MSTYLTHVFHHNVTHSNLRRHRLFQCQGTCERLIEIAKKSFDF